MQLPSGKINVDIGMNDKGETLILLNVGEYVFGLSPADAAALTGQIQCMVASIWGLQAWRVNAAKGPSDHTEGKIIPFRTE